MYIKSIILLVLLTLLSVITAFPCGHSHLSRNRTFNFVSYANEEINDNTLRNTAEYHPLSFQIEYTYFDYYTKQLSQSYKNNMKKAIEKVTQYFGEILSVVSHQNYSFKASMCYYNIFGDEIIQSSSDIVIFPLIQTQYQLGEGILASAISCLVDDKSYRPVAGLLFLGDNYDFNSINADEYLHMLLIHEISHILVFDSELFRHFNITSPVLKTINIRDEQKSIIITPKVVEKARFHFRCNSLEGVELESQGGSGSAGSHWESRIMLGDYMVSTDYDETVIIDITLDLFEDIGWYKVNYYTGGLFRFGKNEGCEFFSKKCIQQKETVFPLEFCSKQKSEGCTAGYLSKGECYLGYFNNDLPKEYQYFSDPTHGGFTSADFCPVISNLLEKEYNGYLPLNCKTGYVTQSKYGEVIGDKSLCVEVNFDDDFMAICYEMKCLSDSKGNRIEIKIKNQVVVCEQGEHKVKVKGFGTLYCPDYNRACSGTEWCNEPLECIEYKSLMNSTITYIEANYGFDKGSFINVNFALSIYLIFVFFIL